jgi:hypothetical protein
VRAFAAGEHIHVSPRAFDPQAGIGIDLLCHELTHVLQQRAGRVDSADPSTELVVDSELEDEARMQEQRYLGGARQALLANVEHRRIGSQARVLQPSWGNVDELWKVLSDYCKSTFSDKDKHVVRGKAITKKNTVVASGTIRYNPGNGDRYIELPAFVSGNPMHRTEKQWKSTGLRSGEGHYQPVRFYPDEEQRDRGEHGNCAERKVLDEAKSRLATLTFRSAAGQLYGTTLTLQSEKTPCKICEGRIDEFRDQFRGLRFAIEARGRWTGDEASTWRYTWISTTTLAHDIAAQYILGAWPGRVEVPIDRKPKALTRFERIDRKLRRTYGDNPYRWLSLDVEKE